MHRVGASAQEIVLGPLVVDDVGRLVADSMHIAGKRAKSSTTYASALTYLVAGHTLLAEDRLLPGTFKPDTDDVRS